MMKQKQSKPEKNGTNPFRSIAAFVTAKDSAVSLLDWIFLAALMLFCFLSFNMRDLAHTAGCSYGYLDGHFRDFYDALAVYGVDEHGGAGLWAGYLPTLYIIFAVWNIPMKLFGVVPSATAQLNITALMWAKILPCLCYFGCGYVVYRICRELGMQHRKAKLLTFAFLSMPVGIIGQFVLGNYESFLILFCLLGFYFWLRRRTSWFVFWFAIAFTCKYTAILLFLPLLLLREKNVWRILLSTAGLFALAALEFLFYSGSPCFRTFVFGIGSLDETVVVTNYIYNSFLTIGFEWDHQQLPVYLTFVAFAFVIAYAYFSHPVTKDEESRMAVYIAGLSLTAFFCLSKWHPQWLMLAVPFWTISAGLHRDAKIFPVIDLIFGVLFVMFMVTHFQGICDETMLSKGVFKYLMQNHLPNPDVSMHNLIGFLSMEVELTLLTAIIAVYGIFKHPKYMQKDPNQNIDGTMGWIRARTAVTMLVFIVPAMYCLACSGHY